MTLEGAMPQDGEAPTAGRGHGCSGTSRLMEEVVERENLKAALRRVRQNKGGPGIDGMKTEELLAGTYRPQAVKRQEIPKRGGGTQVRRRPLVGRGR